MNELPILVNVDGIVTEVKRVDIEFRVPNMYDPITVRPDMRITWLSMEERANAESPTQQTINSSSI